MGSQEFPGGVYPKRVTPLHISDPRTNKEMAIRILNPGPIVREVTLPQGFRV